MSERNDADSRQLADAVAKLCRAFENGMVLECEDLLDEFPRVAANEQLLLELVYTEYVSRERFGHAISMRQWESRFPKLADQLRRLIELDAAIWEESQATQVNFADPDQTYQETDSRRDSGPRQELNSLPSYRVIEELGRGAMGVVYKALDLELGRFVAIKTIRNSAEPGDIARFRIEAKAIAQLSHPNVVQLYKVEELSGWPFIVQEYVEGGSLKAFITDRNLSPRDAAEIVVRVADAIDTAHQRGIIHRDLKPSNVLMTAQETPKVSDFGLAKRLDAGDEQTRTGALLGTPSYMAPEQAKGQTKLIGVRSDVYGLGAILYEALTATPPFRGDSAWETLAAVINDDPLQPRSIRQDIPVDLEVICQKCLEKDPSSRYASAADFADDLRRFLKGEPILARPISATTRCVKWIQRHPAMATMLLVTTLAVMSGLLVTGAWWGNRQASIAQVREDLSVELKAQARIWAGKPSDDLLPEDAWQKLIDHQTRAELLVERLPSSDGLHAEFDRFATRMREEETCREFREELRRIRLLAFATESEGYQANAFDDAFSAAFASMGVDQRSLAQGDLASLEEIPFEWVVAALDHWGDTRSGLTELESSDAEWQAISRLANQLDQDENSRAIRQAILAKDRDTLLEMSHAEDLELSIDAALLLASGLGRLDENQAAIEMLSRMSIDHVGNEWLHSELAALHVVNQPQEYEECLRHATATAALCPNHAGPILMVGNALFGLQRIEEAKKAYLAALAIEPNYAGALNNLGIAYSSQREFEQAEVYLRRAVELEPNDTSALVNLGAVYNALRRFDDVERVYQTLLEHTPNDVSATFLLAVADLERGRFQAALEGYQRVIELTDASSATGASYRPRAQNMVAVTNQCLAIESEWLSDGIPAAEDVPPEMLPNLAQILVYKGAFDESIAYFDWMFELEGDLEQPIWDPFDQRLGAAICSGLASAYVLRQTPADENGVAAGYRQRSFAFLSEVVEIAEAERRRSNHRADSQSWRTKQQLLRVSQTLFAFRATRRADQRATLEFEEAERWRKLWARVDACL